MSECSCYTKNKIKQMVKNGEDASALNAKLIHLNGNILPTWVCNKCGGSDFWVRHYIQKVYDKINRVEEGK